MSFPDVTSVLELDNSSQYRPINKFIKVRRVMRKDKAENVLLNPKLIKWFGGEEHKEKLSKLSKFSTDVIDI